MTAQRKPVDFHPELTLDNVGAGSCAVLTLLLFLAILYFSTKTTILDWAAAIVCGPMVILCCILGVLLAFSQGWEGWKRNKSWREESIQAETRIVGRVETFYEADEESAAQSVYDLTLRMLPEQQAVCPGETEVVVLVSQRVFQRYAGKDTARIYYFPADPMIFLLEGEL